MTVNERIEEWFSGREDELVAALTPLIAIQLMGLVYKLKTAKRTQTVPAAIADDCDMIVDLEEGD